MQFKISVPKGLNTVFANGFQKHLTPVQHHHSQKLDATGKKLRLLVASTLAAAS